MKIDDRQIVDLLDFIWRFSRIIIHYDDNLSQDDWQNFFANSQPFLISQIYHFDPVRIEDELSELHQVLLSTQDPGNIQPIFEYVFHEIIEPVIGWHQTFADARSSFGKVIEQGIIANLAPSFNRFIQFFNDVSSWYCLQSFDLTKIKYRSLWILDHQSDPPGTSTKIADIPGQNNRLMHITQKLSEEAKTFLNAQRELAKKSIHYFEESLIPLAEIDQEKHPPHIALMIAVLKLYKQFQGDLNALSTNHLEFFYTQILNIKARKERPDEVHVLFEIQKNLKNYLLQKDKGKLKNGKDLDDEDILYQLNEDLVIDHAKITDFRSMYLNRIEGNKNGNTTDCSENSDLCDFIEGVYMAPKANTADGIGYKGQSASWYTLGSKESKYIPEEKLKNPEVSSIPNFHPAARIGVVLASPVLLLQEGERTVTLTFCLNKFDIQDCGEPKLDDQNFTDAIDRTYFFIGDQEMQQAIELDISQDGLDFLTPSRNRAVAEDELENGISNSDDLAIAEKVFTKTKAFTISFSGEQGWLPVNPDDVTISFGAPQDKCACVDGTDYELTITINLPREFDPVTFFNSEALQESLDTEMPAVQLILDPNIRIPVTSHQYDPCCSIERCRDEEELHISLYHYFRNLKIADVCIDVKVCDFKNVVVQNEQSLQDVNSDIYPFGTRPDVIDFTVVTSMEAPDPPNLVGPNFYLGSNEVFCKDWTNVWVKINWKDLPADFGKYYAAYKKDGLDKGGFVVNIREIVNGQWINQKLDHQLFADDNSLMGCCDSQFETVYMLDQMPGRFCDSINIPLLQFDVNTRNGFLKITLINQDFLHKDYAFVLGRQMMAFGRYPDLIDGAIYLESGSPHVFDLGIFLGNIGGLIEQGVEDVFQHFGNLIVHIKEVIENALLNNPDNDEAEQILKDVLAKANILLEEIKSFFTDIDFSDLVSSIDFTDFTFDAGADIGDLKKAAEEFFNGTATSEGVLDLFDFDVITDDLKSKIIDAFKVNPIDVFKSLFGDKEVLIPNEPWTPIIKDLSLDYTAKASISDIQFFHLYPFDNSHREESLEASPTLLNYIDNEGSLYLGFESLTPGAGLHLLFQLAEATADSECPKAQLNWYYLKQNNWFELRPGFEIVEDATMGLTRSGIVKVAVPEDMSDQGFTIMPDQKSWIRIQAREHVAAICETIDIHTQAAKVTYQANRPQSRLSMLLEGGKISKLAVADAKIKKIQQPYPSFHGKLEEQSINLFQRISEHLRHKDRGIQSWDYEYLILDRFEEVKKVLAVPHSLALSAKGFSKDLGVAPGFVMVVVIPDLEKLKSGQLLEPKLPLSLLQEIKEWITSRISPFIHLTVVNPRYEKIDVEITIQFQKNITNLNFFKQQLQSDIRQFLSPWLNGQDSPRLELGKSIHQSDLATYIEKLYYVDFICELEMTHQDEKVCLEPGQIVQSRSRIDPKTIRSILTAGDILIDHIQHCDSYCESRNGHCENEYSLKRQLRCSQ